MSTMRPTGLYPATVTPFTETMSIDEVELERHLGETASAEGVSGLAVNGHIGEILSLNIQERAHVIRVAKSVCRADQPVFGGVVGYHADDLVEQGISAKMAGADGLLVMPPIDIRPYRRLVDHAESVLHFFRELDQRVGLPIIVHQYPPFTGVAYSLDVLEQLTQLENVVAVKAASVHTSSYNELWDMLSERAQILAATDAPGLLGMLMHGAHGALIGIAAIEPTMWASLLALVEERKLEQAQKLFQGSCLPIMDAVFENQVPRGVESEASATKEALVLLGKLSSSRVRMPAVPVSTVRSAAIARALDRAGLTSPSEVVG